MICSIVKRLLNLLTMTLFTTSMALFYQLSFVAAFTSDLFHIKTHSCILCIQSSTESIFHPYLKKFKNILYGSSNNFEKPNMLVVEQMWKKWNKLKFLKHCNRESFQLMMIVFRKHFNAKHKSKLIKQGYSFVPISCIPPLRQTTTTTSQLSLTNLQAVKTLPNYGEFIYNSSCFPFNITEVY